MEGFGQRLKEYAKKEHKSVRNLAKILDKQESTISQYITGIRMPKADFLYLLAKLGCDINWLLTGEKHKPDHTKENIDNDKDLTAQITELQTRLEKLENKDK